MAADDLVLDMIKTQSRYDVPEDLTLSCPDVPDHSGFTLGMRGGARYADEADETLKDADVADWPKQKNRNMNVERRIFMDDWEPDGLGGDLKSQDSLSSHLIEQQEPNELVIGHGDPENNGGKHLGSHVTDGEDLGSKMISENGITQDTTLTTVAHKYKSDGSLSDVGMSVAGRVGVEVEDDWWDGEGHPTGERWPPLGAPDDQEEDGSSFDSWYNRDRSCEGGDGGVGDAERERLRQLEEEQDQLSNSLMALTSHFAQVQFRLKQIVDASPEQKEALLTQLEEFANRGIPDIRNPTTACLPGKGDIGEGDETEEDKSTMSRQKELISQLKQQLDDLELYVYETGEGGPPQAQVMERQRVIIEQLKDRLNLNIDEMDKLTLEDLRRQVDRGVRELINPLKMKEQLVSQLQTQISDLERFIDFLQGEGGSVRGTRLSSKVSGSTSRVTEGDGETHATDKRTRAEQRKQKQQQQRSEAEQLRRDTASVVDRVTTLLNMLSFGCGENGRSKFRRNTLKKTPQGSHYGDLRAALEVAIVRVEEAVRPDPCGDSEQTSDSEVEVEGEGTGESLGGARVEVTMAVRKNLTPALRDLMQHGLMPVGQSQSLVPFLSCLPHPPSHRPSKLMHAWDLILQYYHLKKGHQYNHTPARRLSQSFNLEITGGVVTNKQSLLGVIGSIISTHTPLKRSADSHLKAFVSSALNQKKLVVWLRLIFRTQALMEQYYQPWSYTSLTGFEDALRSLDRLTAYNFRLPVDLAVRPFQNMRDAF